MYEALQAEGYRVTYVRIPLTDGTCPLPRDFDTFYSAAAAAGPSDALIYTCQVGGAELDGWLGREVDRAGTHAALHVGGQADGRWARAVPGAQQAYELGQWRNVSQAQLLVPFGPAAAGWWPHHDGHGGRLAAAHAPQWGAHWRGWRHPGSLLGILACHACGYGE